MLTKSLLSIKGFKQYREVDIDCKSAFIKLSDLYLCTVSACKDFPLPEVRPITAISYTFIHSVLTLLFLFCLG
jgi:hypothetical protein